MRNVFASFIVVFVTCAPVAAQTPSEQLMLERAAAVGGEVVVMTDDGGGTVRGRLIGVADSILEVELQSGWQRIPLAAVTRVDRLGDPTTDGVVRGMGTAMVWCALTCDRTGENVRMAPIVGYVALGGVIGGLFDRAVTGRQTLYQRRSTPRIHIGVGPRRGTVTIEF